MSLRRLLPGELVLTPLGRPARVVQVRKDGWIEIQYTAECVALRRELLRPVEVDDSGLLHDE